MRVTDDEGHRHGFPQCSAQPQHNAADYTDLGIWQHNVSHHFPSGGAKTVGGFFQHGRDNFKYITHHGRGEWNHHDGENEAGSEHAYTHGRALKHDPDQGQITQIIVDPGLDMVSGKGCKYESVSYTHLRAHETDSY